MTTTAAREAEAAAIATADVPPVTCNDADAHAVDAYCRCAAAADAWESVYTGVLETLTAIDTTGTYPYPVGPTRAFTEDRDVLCGFGTRRPAPTDDLPF